ncbi:hypothetical protein RHRU231_230034 [Rhodococcus ruber]|uniref:Uncharacterized protein n=1 Tax=Rhodococcus ruber TaxID=1830 RepID=A0A098BHK5_9NOCA|nr:hypothetical protein RHRU231_230034 [Rhodococcus ruber]
MYAAARLGRRCTSSSPTPSSPLPSNSSYRVGKKVRVRTDGTGGSYALLDYLAKRRLSYVPTSGRYPRSGSGRPTPTPK